MTKPISRLLIGAAACCIAACNTASTDANTAESANTKETSSFDLAGARSNIESMAVSFSEKFNKKDSAGIAAFYAEDAQLLPPNSEPVKKPGIISLWGSFMQVADGVKLMVDDVSGNQDQLAETGRYEISGADGKMIDKGKYVVVWKPVNGEWKMYRDIWNSSMPPAK